MLFNLSNVGRMFLRLLIVIFLPFCAFADADYIDLQIIDHKFVPDVIYAPVDKVIKIRVSNLDSTIEEFESFDLKREKIVPANGKITVTVGPLSHGEYSFFGEFHQETAQGKLIIK